MRPCPAVFSVLLTSLLAGCTPPKSESARHALPGGVLFEHHCASCHGPAGKGDGPAAVALATRPSDLTAIAARREGKFPALEIAGIIDGRRALAAHGSRAMPVWGQRYGSGQEAGPMREEQVSGNLLALVEYLESIQAR